MQFEPTKIPGTFAISLSPITDDRGFFSRLYSEKEFVKLGGGKPIVQINHSMNKKKGTVRGMHFQYPPNAETKMICCLRGKVFDVAVDLRKNSPSFLKWYSVELSPESQNMICIPEGCAHGYQTLEENSELLYLHTAYYNGQNEGGVRYDDPRLSINWPIRVMNISEKDKSHPLIDDSFIGVSPFPI